MLKKYYLLIYRGKRAGSPKIISNAGIHLKNLIKCKTKRENPIGYRLGTAIKFNHHGLLCFKAVVVLLTLY